MSTSVRVTVADYDRMIEDGHFESEENRRYELLDGEVVEMPPIGEPHEDVVDRLTSWSVRNSSEDLVRIRVQNSVDISELDSVPQPDVAWVRYRSYRTTRPQTADVFLLIEVSHSSLSIDRGRKARLYAQAGIADYWIVDVKGRRVEVRRDPRDGAYQSIRVYAPGESIPLLAFPELAFPVGLLFEEGDDQSRTDVEN